MTASLFQVTKIYASFVFIRSLRLVGVAPNLNFHLCQPRCPRISMARYVEQLCENLRGPHLVVRTFHTVLTLGILASLLYKDSGTEYHKIAM